MANSATRDNRPLTDDDKAPRADEVEKIKRAIDFQDLDFVTGGAEGDVSGAAVAGAEGSARTAGDWKGGNPGVPGTEFPEDPRGKDSDPDHLRIISSED